MGRVRLCVVDEKTTDDLCSRPSPAGTGEHGVGIGKKEFLVDELGVGTVQLMRTIKRAIDPDELFNPGKVSL